MTKTETPAAPAPFDRLSDHRACVRELKEITGKILSYEVVRPDACALVMLRGAVLLNALITEKDTDAMLRPPPQIERPAKPKRKASGGKKAAAGACLQRDGKRHKYTEAGGTRCICGAPKRGHEPGAGERGSRELFTHFRALSAKETRCGRDVASLDKNELSADLGVVDCPDCVGGLRADGALPEVTS